MTKQGGDFGQCILSLGSGSKRANNVWMNASVYGGCPHRLARLGVGLLKQQKQCGRVSVKIISEALEKFGVIKSAVMWRAKKCEPGYFFVIGETAEKVKSLGFDVSDVVFKLLGDWLNDVDVIVSDNDNDILKKKKQLELERLEKSNNDYLEHKKRMYDAEFDVGTVMGFKR